MYYYYYYMYSIKQRSRYMGKGKYNYFRDELLKRKVTGRRYQSIGQCIERYGRTITRRVIISHEIEYI